MCVNHLRWFTMIYKPYKTARYVPYSFPYFMLNVATLTTVDICKYLGRIISSGSTDDSNPDIVPNSSYWFCSTPCWFASLVNAILMLNNCVSFELTAHSFMVAQLGRDFRWQCVSMRLPIRKMYKKFLWFWASVQCDYNVLWFRSTTL